MIIEFGGAIQGRVKVRKGETEDEAVERAEAFLLSVLERHAKSLSLCNERPGPNICLEILEVIEEA